MMQTEFARRAALDMFNIKKKKSRKIYMLTTVLHGELAEQQSIFIMCAFREMRHYIKQNQQFVTQAEMHLFSA